VGGSRPGPRTRHHDRTGASRSGPAALKSPSGPTGIVAGLTVCLCALMLGSCSGASTTPATTSAPAATSAAAGTTASDQVIADYRAMWSDLVTAAETSDFQSTLLPLHATGAALTLFVRGLARDRLHAIVTRGITTHRPRVTSLSPPADPDRATVADCFDDTQWIEYTTSGAKAKNTPGGKRATTAELVKTSGTWKVSQITIGATGTC
jgi:hypothetical protein